MVEELQEQPEEAKRIAEEKDKKIAEKDREIERIVKEKDKEILKGSYCSNRLIIYFCNSPLFIFLL